MKKIILSLVLCGGMVMAADYYSRNSYGIVTDSSTNLMWDDNDILGLDGQPDVNAELMTWEEAVDYCDTLVTGDLSASWRLPNANELYTIVDRTRIYSIDPVFEEKAYDAPFWTSTSVANDPSKAYTVHFNGGWDVIEDKSASHYVRCVHNDPLPGL